MKLIIEKNHTNINLSGLIKGLTTKFSILNINILFYMRDIWENNPIFLVSFAYKLIPYQLYRVCEHMI
jgi:hypothetical protein